MEVDKICISWNLFRSHYLHEQDAASCALRLRRQIAVRLQRCCKLVLVSDKFVVGNLDSEGIKTTVIHGKHVQVAQRLLSLSTPQTRYQTRCLGQAV